MNIRDRIKDFRRVPACDLIPNPKNWRQHPPAQVDAMRGVLAEIGFAGAVLARETPDGLMLIDGHLRADEANGSPVPVLVLDVTEAEADVLLATFDPIAAMATAQAEQLNLLLTEIETDNAGLSKLLEALGQPPTEEEDRRDNGLLTREEIQAAETEESQPDKAVPAGEIAGVVTSPKCPIVPRYAEHYQAFIIVCENIIDEAWIRNRLNLEEGQKSHKGKTIAKANIITCADLRGVLE